MTTRVQRHNLQPWKEERAPVSRNRIPGALSRGRNKHFGSTDYADYTARPRPQPILAPEEPNIYRTAINQTTRAPAERNVSDDDCTSRASFAPLERGGVFWIPFSIYISSLRDEELIRSC